MPSSSRFRAIPPPIRTFGGQTLERTRAISVAVSNVWRRRRCLNVGGGPWFAHPGWDNLEEVRSLINRRPYRLSPSGVWPFPDDSLDTVYTSHVLEHLDDNTVGGVLTQAFRVLRPGGRLIICIPDFDRARECWASRNPSFFTDRHWSYGQVAHTWKNRGITDSLDYRAAFLFCGFWTAEYGHPFKRDFHHHPRAYHGPPPVAEDILAGLPGSRPPSQVSRFLRDWVLANETGIQFNHQNAWSRAELVALLAGNGFQTVSCETRQVVTACADVPRISRRAGQSTFCLAMKP